MVDPKYILPNGNPYDLWEDKTQYKTLLHVSQKSGSLNGDGSEKNPFLTIAQAVPLAKPGTKVIIHEGIYRETVRPIYGGNSETEMVMFCAAEGEQVEITGAEIFNGTFRDSEGWKKQEGTIRNRYDFDQPEAKVYAAKFDRNAFIGTNPFGAINGPVLPWWNGPVPKLFNAKNETNRQIVSLRRGMLFCDGERMEQVLNYYQLGEKDNRFFIEDDGITFHIRFKGDSAPEGHTLEYTAREYGFYPEEKYFAYIHLQNLTFTKGGNGFPPPQAGVISTNCGHHWLVEGCKVLYANGVGMDIGFQCPNRFSTEPRGHHIIRGCEFSYCGIVGLTGMPANSETFYLDNIMPSILVEDCRFVDNCYHNFESLCENAAFKMHRLHDSLIINNYISGVGYASGIWLDSFNENVLVEGNVILHVVGTYGGIFLEASNDLLTVRHNIVIDSRINTNENGGNGIYSHTCEDIKTIRNICLECEKYGIVHHWHDLPEWRSPGGTGFCGFNFDTFENIVSHCDYLVMLGREKNEVDGNIYGVHRQPAPLRIVQPRAWLDLKHWQKNYGYDVNGRMADISYELQEDKRLLLTIDGKTHDIDLLGNIPAQIDQIFS